jgi:hypothetical protein
LAEVQRLAGDGEIEVVLVGTMSSSALRAPSDRPADRGDFWNYGSSSEGYRTG